MFHGRIVQDTPSWPWYVHMCPHVCMCNMQLSLLGRVAPSPLAIDVPDVLVVATISWKHRGAFRKLVATTSQDLLCRTECEPIT